MNDLQRRIISARFGQSAGVFQKVSCNFMRQGRALFELNCNWNRKRNWFFWPLVCTCPTSSFFFLFIFSFLFFLVNGRKGQQMKGDAIMENMYFSFDFMNCIITYILQNILKYTGQQQQQQQQQEILSSQAPNRFPCRRCKMAAEQEYREPYNSTSIT